MCLIRIRDLVRIQDQYHVIGKLLKLVRHLDDVGGITRGGVAALGNFDGFHQGHHVVVGEAGRLARSTSSPLVVVTTEPHPRTFFSPQSPSFRLTPFRDRARLFEKFGVDVLVALTFDDSLAKTSAENFIRRILAKELDLAQIVVGYDYRFGHKRTGDSEFLARAGAEQGMKVTIIEPVSCHLDGLADQIFSSTQIRDALRSGRPREAASMLGHWWSISARVVHGEHRGAKLGFPTANLDIHDSLAPKRGVYAVRVLIEEKGEDHLPAVANFGRRPTFGEEKDVLEVHLLDFDNNLYDHHLTIEFVEFLRGERSFDGVEELIAQINQDCQRAGEVLSKSHNKQDTFLPTTLDAYLARFPDAAPKASDFRLDR